MLEGKVPPETSLLFLVSPQLEVEEEEDDENSVETYSSLEERDEVKEVQKLASQDNERIRACRGVVTGVLLVTALAVTLTTFAILQDQQDQDFKNSFDIFSRAVAEAATARQVTLRTALDSFAADVASFADATNATFPFFTFPHFERHAQDVLFESGVGSIAVLNKVSKETLNDYITYTNAHYETWTEQMLLLNPKLAEKFTPKEYHPYVTNQTAEGDYIKVTSNEAPVSYLFWTSSPAYDYSQINWDVALLPDNAFLLLETEALQNETVFGKSQEIETSMSSTSSVNIQGTQSSALVFYPVHEIVGDYRSEIVAVLMANRSWDSVLKGLFPDNVVGIRCIIYNSCNQIYSYDIDGPNATYLGEGDLHENKYDILRVLVDLEPQATNKSFSIEDGHCEYKMHIYPTSRFETSHNSQTPEVFASVVAITFVMVAIVFFVYDLLVEKRNSKLVHNAARSNAIVSSLFPDNIRDRLIGANRPKSEAGDKPLEPKPGFKNVASPSIHQRVDDKQILPQGSKPLADLFLESTIMFADIVGFTAWSSVREPVHVFTLLEALYGAFDEIAKKRRIFKVETVGDCYVAAAGLPEARKDHAVAMVRFARDIMNRMAEVTSDLEVTLGPDTGELKLRIGIHSGPVTAGVLRGDRSRFQLFGDTMNTTSRIESTGQPGRIHLSQETAEILQASGKGSWLLKREDQVKAKGKGELQTYWLNMRLTDKGERTTTDSSETGSRAPSMIESTIDDAREKAYRLVEWNVESLLHLLKQIVARRGELADATDASSGTSSTTLAPEPEKFAGSPLDEVQEIISLPEFDVMRVKQHCVQDIYVSPQVIDQLRSYVTCVSSMYQKHPFHNFEHASHVTMSVVKLLSRIVAPVDMLAVHHDESDKDGAARHIAAKLHDHTYGITSDPLTQFACAFCALVHDIDHPGVSNAVLVQENAQIAAVYKNRSVAEQNSLVLAWDLLMDECFSDLRATVCSTEAELKRFRQLLVNGVMATDIVDKELKALRDARWNTAFNKKDSQGGETITDSTRVLPEQASACSKSSSECQSRSISCSQDDINRKATIVIEHILQASDVAHTMQHWHVYRKWNERFFRECYDAYRSGRTEQDPSISWYQGELGFFDFYIIPLAKKLKECGVFGKSSDEYLSYALKNRQEWEARGQNLVAEMLEKAT